MKLRRPRRVLVVGGASSGKSQHAERLLARQRNVTYVATGPSDDGKDPEWTERIQLHRERRPSSWATIETLDVAGVLTAPGGPVLIECVSTWLAAAMDHAGIWSDAVDCDDNLATACERLQESWAHCQRPAVAVTSEVGASIVPSTVAGRRYRTELGRLNAALAEAADTVWLVTVGIPRKLR